MLPPTVADQSLQPVPRRDPQILDILRRMDQFELPHFEWSRSVEDPTTYVLIEAFTDEGAEPHVNSEHFRTMQQEFPQYLAATPQIVSQQVDVEDWGPMGEVTVD